MRLVQVLCLVFLSSTAMAQEMPPPRKMPRTPVSRQTLVEAAPASRELHGVASIIDGERLRIEQTDVRLFGIVPPQLAASFGPQARNVLDNLAGAQAVSCTVRDRDRDGRLLATCANANGNDMALDLLKRGLAVTARGTLAGTDLAAPYAAAEQAAQTARIGLWSLSVAGPVNVQAIPKAEPEPKAEVKPEPKPEPKAEAKKEEKPRNEARVRVIEADVLSQEAEARIDDPAWARADVGFVERYQILLCGLLMLATAGGVVGARGVQRLLDKREELRALAAALRGELMAARGVCFGRSKTITCSAEDRTAVWPRIRSTLYQAYVGRLGLLGAELARQIASVYGQTSDYAALYNPASGTLVEVPKKQALDTLTRRIDEILPRLSEIERRGKLPSALMPRQAHHHAAVAPLELVKSEPEASIQAIAIADVPVQATTTPSAIDALNHLWENVRNFVISRQAAEPSAPPPPLMTDDPQATDYTAIIEADMERYQYGENVEAFDPPPHHTRKRKSS